MRTMLEWISRSRRKCFTITGTIMSISLAIAIAQGFFCYNAYILPLLILGAILCFLLFFITGQLWQSFSARHPKRSKLLMGLVAIVLISGELITINESQVYVCFLQNRDSLSGTILEPTFSEKIEKVTFQWGNSKQTFDIKSLREKRFMPFYFNGFTPIAIYAEGDKLYADVHLFGGDNKPPVEIIHNKIETKPSWDRNYDSNALEVVDENYKPVFQMIYESQSHIIIRGIFYFHGGLMFISEGPLLFNPPKSALNLKPIFRYPSSKYKGIRKGFLW